MAENTEVQEKTQEAPDAVIKALLQVLENAASPEMLRTQQFLQQRLALTGNVIPSRLPAPKNVTEVGGYLNLLDTLDEPELRAQVLASLLGVAGPTSPFELHPRAPVLFFASRANDRPAGPQQAAIPLNFTIRSDFAAALETVMKEIHELGCQLPLLTPVRTLPPANGSATAPDDLLLILGRTLDLVPAAALNDPESDPLALARLEAENEVKVVARQLDASAPRAAEIASASWVAWRCDTTACEETTAERSYLPLSPILNKAGWYQQAPAAPESLLKPGNWARWVNTTGLVAGATRFGDELQHLYSPSDIAVSFVRERVHWLWDGSAFVEPGS